MAVTKVSFQKGLQSVFDRMLQTGTGIDPGTFYITLDEEGNVENFYLGKLKLNNYQDILDELAKIEIGDLSALKKEIGDINELKTSVKDNLVGAINEVFDIFSTANDITISEDTSNPEYAKVYTVSQGEREVGTINIPKDMVVESGEVVTNPTEELKGTYIALTIANKKGDVIYIDVRDLANEYTAEQNAKEIQLVINSEKVISATIKSKSITLDKLSDDVVSEIADSITLEPGTEDGTVKFNGVDVSVTGLGSAAYKDSNAFDLAGSSSAALSSAKQYTDEQLNKITSEMLSWQVFEE